MRAWAGVLLLVAVVGADDLATLYAQWESAGPDERRYLKRRVHRLEKQRRYVAARPVLVDFEGRDWTLAEFFETVLEPALHESTEPKNETDPGLTDVHRRALAAIPQLQRAYRTPRLVTAGTLNLMLGYAARALFAHELPVFLRLRFFSTTLTVARSLVGRMRPDIVTGFVIRTQLVPGLTALARRHGKDEAVGRALSEAASLLSLPALVGEHDRARLATLTSGAQSRQLLVRVYREGRLGTFERAALARSVVASVKDDLAFAVGSPPLLLELLTDPRVAARERGALADCVLGRLGEIELLRPSVHDLLVAAFGNPEATLKAGRERRKARPGSLRAPAPGRRHRFLRVLLAQAEPDAPPRVTEVMRADVSAYRAFHSKEADGRRYFLGVLLPDKHGDHADFVGPPPRLAGVLDNRLLRRRLRRERLSITAFGTRREVLELCATLPEDDSEPVPVHGADLGHIVALLRARLRLAEDDERRELVGLLVRLGTDAAHDLAAKEATSPGAAMELLPLVEKGHAAATERLLQDIAVLELSAKERVLRRAASQKALRPRLRQLCGHEDVAVACLATDALLSRGDAGGIPVLFRHKNRYARASAGALALRTTELAGGLRIIPEEPLDMEQLRKLAAAAFGKKDGKSFVTFGKWLAGAAFQDPLKVRRARSMTRRHFLGRRRVSGGEFVRFWADAFLKKRHEEFWAGLVQYVFSPIDPGQDIDLDRLKPLIAAVQTRLDHAALRTAWRDSLVVLACAQYGVDLDTGFFDLAHDNLKRLAGKGTPVGARGKAGVLWPVWAAADAQ